jgi:glycosyltransferase involved in cell wall biosynthesis
LDSILRSTYKNIEICILNDGSTDGTQSLLESYAARDSRIKLFEKVNERSIAKSRSFLLGVKTGELFTFMDHDDFVHPRFVETLYRTLTDNDADLAVCGINWVVHGFKFRPTLFTHRGVYSGDRMMAELLLGGRLFPGVWNKLFRSNIAGDLRFNHNLGEGDDVGFTFEYAKRCRQIAYYGRAMYNYVKNKQSVIHQPFGERKLLFWRGLEKLIAEETNPRWREYLAALRAFTGAAYFYMARKQKSFAPGLRAEFAAAARTNGKLLLHTRRAGWIYKTSFRFIRAFFIRRKRFI